ncbi:hypothetical protein HUG17_5458 [Dermatophagoides farinae]|uniref:RanBP2-type domain-containing protein n=2 Tax=Dermatophagoides farinae TaxID=6954 RepID=A0A9D4SI54_DERFA|nr:hypothetical protein HUG17_5458 [Dermatophagoides farinae]
MHEIHLAYINSDQCEAKMKLRKRLESLIDEYLMIVRHTDKFTFREFRDCLETTCKKSNFDPEKVIAAFELVERYALNLLNYPWRHEYHKIFAFGYFRLIKCSLSGHSELLQLIGYNYDPSLDIYVLTEMPIDPDKMIAISFDCLVSIVEIQIMLDIKTKCPDKMSWNDIYSIRCQYICNVQSAVQIFCDLKRNNKLTELSLDLDFPDYSMKTFNKLDLWLPINSTICSTSKDNSPQHNKLSPEIILPPPPSYLESDLDMIDFIDSSTPKQNEQTSFKTKSNTEYVCHTAFIDDLKSTNTATRRIISGNLKPNNSDSQQTNSPSNPNSSFLYRSSPKDNDINPTKRSISKENLLNNHKQLIELEEDNNFQPLHPEPTKSIMSNGWSCTSCTYVNDEIVEICIMCHRSRTKGNESTPLITGGRQCNKCTLVNDKKEKFCTACGTSLADSPTYI